MTEAIRIVVASDLSDMASRAVRRGFRLAQELRGTLDILHIVDSALPSRLSAQALAAARDLLEAECTPLAAETGVQPGIEVAGGDPRLELAHRARAKGAGLVVAGMHRRRAVALFTAARSMPGELLARLGLPLLVVQQAADAPYRRVVVGVDFSVFSRPAIRWARRLAPTGTLLFVHGYEVPFKPYLGPEDYGAEFAYAERLELDQFLAEEMETLAERAHAAGVPAAAIEKRVVEGAPAEVLRRTAAEEGADLLVVGTHGRAGLLKAVLGSVAADLVRDPPTDLLVVPARS